MIEKIRPNLTFEINNSKDFFDKLVEEYSDFDKQHLNPRYAMNCAITSWHLTDWTYHEYFKDDLRFQDSEKIDKNGCVLKISGLLKYQQYIISQCPEMEYMRLITNGIKHCILKDQSRKEKTIIQPGDFSSDFSRHDFNVNRFIIELDDDKKIDFEKTLVTTINFWKDLLQTKEKKK
jgi:hypothetical protein